MNNYDFDLSGFYLEHRTWRFALSKGAMKEILTLIERELQIAEEEYKLGSMKVKSLKEFIEQLRQISNSQTPTHHPTKEEG
jgi:hypothetical protein